jgi:purine nucleoside permease
LQILGEAFENFTTLITNGTGVYGYTAQEDNASLSSLMRAAIGGYVDFSRIILMRSASDFDRPPPNVTAFDNLFTANQGFFIPSLINLYLTGRIIISDIMMYWNTTYLPGIAPSNYIGDILGSLVGVNETTVPDFGTYPNFGTG